MQNLLVFNVLIINIHYFKIKHFQTMTIWYSAVLGPSTIVSKHGLTKP